PGGRWSAPADTARLVAWLLSDEADWVAGNKTLVILSAADGKPVSSGTVHTGLTDHVVAAGGALYLTRGANIRAYAP
ncbi:hypothetical protein AB0M20_42935, partial [Actinoplanes sp. NPDC051633]